MKITFRIYAVFYELSTIRSTGGALRASINLKDVECVNVSGRKMGKVKTMKKPKKSSDNVEDF